MSDPAPEPIIVPASPLVDQAGALLRQGLLALSVVTATLGLAKESTVIVHLSDVATQIVTVASVAGSLGVIVWGQLKTRLRAKQVATMATALPDTIAATK